MAEHHNTSPDEYEQQYCVISSTDHGGVPVLISDAVFASTAFGFKGRSLQKNVRSGTVPRHVI